MHTSTPAIAESRRPHAGKPSQASLLHQSDERLVSLARSGSERAWAEITRRYGRQLAVYCTRFVGVNRAEDAVQQTFLQAFLSLRDGSHREIVLRAWLYRIAHNCSIDVLRKGSTDYDELDLEYDGVAQPPAVFEQREEIRRIVARMRDLPEAQRQALALRELEGRSYEEISAQLGHSGSGVRQLIFRARTALRNSAAAILPFGSHHVATTVSVPASSGTGVETIGAATLAAVAVLGGGLVAAEEGPRPARPGPAPALSASPSPPASAVGERAEAQALRSAPGSGFSVRRPREVGSDGAGLTPAPVVPAPPAAAPAAPPAVAPPTAGNEAPAAAPPAQTPPADDVRQQSLTSGAPAGAPATTQAPAPAPGATTPAPGPATPGSKPAAPAGSGTKPAGPQPAPAKASPPAPPAAQKPVKPVKGAPVKQPPKTAPKLTAPKPAPPKGQARARTGERR